MLVTAPTTQLRKADLGVLGGSMTRN